MRASALGVTVDELFDVLTVVDADLADRCPYTKMTSQGIPASIKPLLM